MLGPTCIPFTKAVRKKQSIIDGEPQEYFNLACFGFFTVVYDMLLNYWYQPGFGTEHIIRLTATWESSVKAGGLAVKVKTSGQWVLQTGEGYRLFGWPFLQKRRENRYIKWILCNRYGKLSLGSSGGVKGEKTFKEYFICLISHRMYLLEDTKAI